MASISATPSVEESSPDSTTLLPTSTPSSPPSDENLAKEEIGQNGHPIAVSETMLDEERKLEAASKRAETKRQREIENARQRDISSGKETDDSMYNKIQFLLGQSKVRGMRCSQHEDLI